MEENIYNIKKFQKSKHNQQCIGPCYQKNTKILHPLYFETATNPDESFCPVVKWLKGNDEQILDECFEVTTQEAQVYNTMDLLFPYVNFNTQLFLNLFYKIVSYSNGIDWLYNNKHLNINSLIRVYDLIFETYGDTLDVIEFTDPKLIEILIHIIKVKYLDKLIIKLTNFITIENNEVFLKKNIKKDDDDTIKIKTNYIIKKYLNVEVLKEFMINYFNNKQHNFSELYSNIVYLIINYINYIIEQINKLL